ncbi:MAG: UDP-N-acetylmuramoyl-L-alanyl-D-glutamate--2,6-diaminopimelate ligase [Bacillota bacterium]|nr:UDP-N-acetylmuramoyl-L-alanyl-D-glutamate--2,6-diaminopimelate ligase [Bacillota bacterium]
MILLELLNGIDCEITQGNLEIDITDIIYDSRKAIPNCAFVCLKGYNLNSHDFVDAAVTKGASVIIASDKITAPENVTIIMVEDTRKALALLSCNFFRNPAKELVTVGITGTKGKTTTAAMIRSILNHAGIPTASIGTLGILMGENQIKTENTTPESYEIQKAMREMVDIGIKAVAIEASSLGLKWHRTDGFVFDYGVFTNFAGDHIGPSEHADMQEYMECKSMLFRQCKLGLINIDDKHFLDIIKDHTCEIETYGMTSNAMLTGYKDELIAKPGFLGVHFNTKGIMDLSVDVGIPGRFNVYNALAAIAVTRHFNITDNDIKIGLEQVCVKGRIETVPIHKNYTLIIDYAHNAMSMENVLGTLKAYHPKRIITMFGAGGNRPKSRRYEMGEVSGKMSDLSVITEDNSRFEDVLDIIADIKQGIDKTDGKYVVIPNRPEAIKYCMDIARDGDIVVLAGKGHEDYQEIKGVKYHLDEREIIAEILKGT